MFQSIQNNNYTKKYYSIYKLMQDIPHLKNETIGISRGVERQSLSFDMPSYRSLKKRIHDNNIKMIEFIPTESEINDLYYR